MKELTNEDLNFLNTHDFLNTRDLGISLADFYPLDGKLKNKIQEIKAKRIPKRYRGVLNYLENEILTPKFLNDFWVNVYFQAKTKKITERDLQRIFCFKAKFHYPHFFTKMVSDLPGVSSSLGYDIHMTSEGKTLFIEMKVEKGKIENSQKSFKSEVQGYDFLEYSFLIWDIEKNSYRVIF